MNKNVFAVDIGGSKLILAVITPDGQILDRIRTDYAPGHTPETLFRLIEEGYARLKVHSPGVCAAAIPGLCDPERGMWLYSPFSGIGGIPMTDKLTQMTGLPSCADNDVNISALAERRFGLCRETDDFLWVTVSNGIGGGLFLNGRLYRGANMTAGEIGHLIVEEENGRRCGCGNVGCLEAMASGASIAAIYADRTGESVSAKAIADRARQGEKQALDVWQEAGGYIGKASAAVMNLLGLETVVLGGGAAEAFDLLEGPALKAIDRFLFKGARLTPRLLHSALGAQAALMGCCALAHEVF